MNMRVQKGSFSYGKRQILKNIQFEIRGGELVTILGPNGVGKTTLIKCLLGFSKWTEGSTYFNGERALWNQDKSIWKKISYVPQAKDIPLAYSVESVVLMGRNPFMGLFGQPSKQDYDCVDHVLEQLELSPLKHKKMIHLSGGEKQMVLIARALVSNPELIVLDEPELNLDLANQDKIYSTLRQLVDRAGISCLANTHHPFNAVKYSDQTLLLKKDSTYIFGRTKCVLTQKNIRETFGLSANYFDTNYYADEKQYAAKSS